MIFHSSQFLIFFAIVLPTYWLLRKVKYQNLFLTVMSYIFYGFIHPWFVILIWISTVIDFSMAKLLVSYPDKKKVFLAVSILSNFGMLGVFKYFNFFIGNISSLLNVFGLNPGLPILQIILPVGISFYTFQTVSYLIDVYKGDLKPTRNFLTFALFVSFFPQLVAGPIERADRMLPQFDSKRTLTRAQVMDGITLILWGYLKKLVIADNVAVITNKIFLLQDTPWPILIAGVAAFAIQIYADFSAYSDIARGLAKLMGFELMLNFNHPYIARSASEFWRRWHISLSNWIRDYVYISLGGSRKGRIRTYVNILLAFLFSGLWHGANWNYIIWGGYWGLLLVTQRFFSRFTHSVNQRFLFKSLTLIVTLLVTGFGWLMFRETDINYLLSYTLSSVSRIDLQIGIYFVGMVALYSIPLWMHALFDSYFWERLREYRLTTFLMQHTLNAILIIAIIGLHSTVQSDFIYFQF